MAFLSDTLLNFYRTGDTICFLSSTERYLIELFEHCGCCFQCLRSLVSSKTLPNAGQIFVPVTRSEKILVVFFRTLI